MKKNQKIKDRTEFEILEAINKYEPRIFLQRISFGDITKSSGLLSGFNAADRFLEETKSILIAIRLFDGEDSEILGFIEGDIIGFENLIRKHKYSYDEMSRMIRECVGLNSSVLDTIIGRSMKNGLFTEKYSTGSNSNVLWLKEIYIKPEYRRNWISKMIMYSLKKSIKDLYGVSVDWIIISNYKAEKKYLQGYEYLGFNQIENSLSDSEIENVILNLGFISIKGNSYNLNDTDFYYTYLPSVPDLSELEFIDFDEKELLMLNFFLTTYQSIDYYKKAFFASCEYCEYLSSFIDFSIKNGSNNGLIVNAFDIHMLMLILCDLESCVFSTNNSVINISSNLKSALTKYDLNNDEIKNIINKIISKVRKSDIFKRNGKLFFKNTILLTGKNLEENQQHGALFINNLNIYNLRIISNSIKFRVHKELIE